MKRLLLALTLLGCSAPVAPFSPAAPAAPEPAVPAAPEPPVALEPLPTSCGALTLRLAALEHQGKDKAHSARGQVKAALGACVVDIAADVRACQESRARHLAQQAHGGPQHPDMRAASDELALCEAWLGPDLAPPARGADAPIAGLDWNELANGARKAGWNSVSLGSAGGTGVERYWGLFIHKDQRRASLMAFDFPADDALSVVRMGRSQALHVQTQRRVVLGPKGLDARPVLDALAGRAPLGFPTRSALVRAAEALPLAGAVRETTGYTLVDGLVGTSADLGAANTNVELLLLDYQLARAEGRVLLDGRRVLVVSVCSSCPGSERVGVADPRPFEGTWDAAAGRALTAAIAAHAQTLATGR